METTYSKIPKQQLTKSLRERDGDICMHPSCGLPLEFGVDENGDSIAAERMIPTIDHKHPVSQCKAEGWAFEDIWALSNLQIMHKHCNAKKGNKLYLPDGTLPPSKQRKIARAEKRASRPMLTDCCYSGRLLLPGEFCDECGREAMTHTTPVEYVCKPSDCPHSGPWSCFACYLGMVARVPAIVDVLDGEYLDVE